MNETIRFRPAGLDDLESIRRLLSSCDLPSSDIELGAQRFVVACEGAEVVGAIGLEPRGAAALLRSLAVAPSRRGRRLGEALYARAVALATRLRVRDLYLLTTTAEGFFARRGFAAMDRRAAPAEIAATSQFTTTCCASARCMHLSLGREARHLPGDALALEPDVAGARSWAVPLERAMLRYFEVEAGGLFPRHAHEAEQITFVLEGELRFALDGRPEVVVRAGEVIAIPGGLPHAVSGGPGLTRAVDAWSPPPDPEARGSARGG